MKMNNSVPHYVIYAQNRDNTLIIKDIHQNLYIATTASKILANRELVAHFDKRHLCIVQAILKEEAR